MDSPRRVDPASDEFASLVLRYLDRSVSPEEQALLRELLVRSPEHRDAYVFLARQRGQLGELMTSERARVVEEARPSTRRTGWRPPAAQGGRAWGIALAAAAALLALLLTATLSSRERPEGAPRQSADRERDRAEAERRRAEARLEQIELERRRLSPAPQDPGLDEKRRSDLDRLAREKEQVERELQEAVDRAKKAQDALASIPMKPGEPRTGIPSPQDPPVPKPTPDTQSAVARMEEVWGQTYLLTQESQTTASAGTHLKPGQSVKTGPAGRALLRFPDGTLVDLAPGSFFTPTQTVNGKVFVLHSGVLRSVVAKQPKDQALVFSTPHGVAKVLGTTLRLIVEPDPAKGMRLEVDEGKVELRNLAGKTVSVESGHYAVAASGVELIAKPLPISEVLLYPRHGKISGAEWRRVKDDAATEGTVFETTPAPNLQKAPMTDADREKIGRWFVEGRSTSWVTYTFQADANKEYLVWVRGRCTGTGNRMLQDSILLEVPNGQFVRRPADWFPYPDTLCFFDGFSVADGYWWSGGSHDPAKTQTPIAVKFAKAGTQTIRMHVAEPPMRVDAIWLSVAQTERPK